MALRSALLSLGLAGALLAGALATPALATPEASLTRLGGAERFATAVAISRDGWPAGSASAAVLARADAFPDALAGTPLAVAKSGPLLLTTRTSLSSGTAAELRRALPTGRTVYLLGGTTALSDGVARAVASLGYRVVRLGGADRYATAVTINGQLGAPAVVFEATGTSYQYALIAGVAAAASRGVVVLTSDGQLPASSRAYLARLPGVSRVAVGPGAVAADPGATPVRGADAYDTSRLLAEQRGPLLLTAPSTLPAGIRAYLSARSGTLTAATVYGGPVAVSTAVEDVVTNALRGARAFGEGTKRLGTDVVPGTYRTRRAGAFCYWERLSGFSGGLEDIISNGLGTTTQVVTIGSGDVGFRSRDCGTWTSDLSALTASPTAPFGAGTWIVGTDIAAGTWAAPGGDSCYWERLAGFSGTLDDVLANDIGSRDLRVTVTPSDAGFRTNDCGSWRLVG